MNKSPVLSVQNLRVAFQSNTTLNEVLHGISYDVFPNEILGIVGESGSGKSVASLAVMGLLPPKNSVISSGAVIFNNEDLLNYSQKQLEELRGQKIAMIFQEPMSALNPSMNCGKQVEEILLQHTNISKKAAKEEVIRLFNAVKIPEPESSSKKYPHEISGGQQQRVMIAMALLCGPEVLFADEPTTALDVTIQAQILELMKNLQKSIGTAVVLVTHDLGVVAGITDRVAVMYAGRIVEEGTTAEVFANPQHPYTRGLLESMPRIDTPIQKTLYAIPGLPPDLGNLPAGCPFHPRCASATNQCQNIYPETRVISSTHQATCWEVEGSK